MARTKTTRQRKKGRSLYRLKKNWRLQFKVNSVTDPSRRVTEEYVPEISKNEGVL